jgi:hypothetical protein
MWLLTVSLQVTTHLQMCVCADLGDGHVAEVATEVLEVEIQPHPHASSSSVSHASEQQQQSAATSTEGKHVQLVLVA